MRRPDRERRPRAFAAWPSGARILWFWDRVIERVHQAATIWLSWWPIGILPPRQRRRDTECRIAYYTWHFPVLSQTFVHRELSGLVRAGVNVIVVADDTEDPSMADDNARLFLDRACYLNPLDRGRLAGYRRFFFLTRPLTSLNLLIYVLTHRYERFKSYGEDWRVFGRAVYLAGVLRDLHVDHVHTPWADRSAFVAMLAARLLRIPYSVQARAHELHRRSYLFGLRERFEQATFAVTNTEYNRARMHALVAPRHRRRISVIRNGIDLHRFVPRPPRHRSAGEPIRLLTVARLIEQKGLTDLLRACDRLRERGVAFRCEIIGGPEAPLFTNYFVSLKKLHRRLALGDRVFFRGPLPFTRVLEAYAEADIFVLPSVIAADGSRDITPNSLLEAMAMKLPVVSTPVTGIPEIVEDGVNGILVPPHDPDALAAAIERLSENPALRMRLGHEARLKVEATFDLDRTVAGYVALFSRTPQQASLDEAPRRVLESAERRILPSSDV